MHVSPQPVAAAVMRNTAGPRRPVPGLWCLVAVTWCVPVQALEIDAAAIRGALVLPAEPDGPVTPTAAREKLGKEPRPIVVAGRVGARGMDPFLADKASFMLVEIPADDHAKKPGHDNDNCPFCKKRQAAAPMVAVRFVGADGKELPIDSRKLFGIQKGSDVVVRGSGVFDAKLGIPVIQLTADAIYVRPPAK